MTCNVSFGGLENPYFPYQFYKTLIFGVSTVKVGGYPSESPEPPFPHSCWGCWWLMSAPSPQSLSRVNTGLCEHGASPGFLGSWSLTLCLCPPMGKVSQKLATELQWLAVKGCAKLVTAWTWSKEDWLPHSRGVRFACRRPSPSPPLSAPSSSEAITSSLCGVRI